MERWPVGSLSMIRCCRVFSLTSTCSSPPGASETTDVMIISVLMCDIEHQASPKSSVVGRISRRYHGRQDAYLQWLNDLLLISRCGYSQRTGSTMVPDPIPLEVRLSIDKDTNTNPLTYVCMYKIVNAKQLAHKTLGIEGTCVVIALKIRFAVEW